MKLNDIVNPPEVLKEHKIHHISSFEDIIIDQNNTIQALRSEGGAILNLLATIHCDGGHYTEKHGIEKSVVDAIEKWHMTQVNFEDAKTRVQELAEVIQHKDEVIAKQEKANDTLRAEIAELKGKRVDCDKINRENCDEGGNDDGNE